MSRRRRRKSKPRPPVIDIKDAEYRVRSRGSLRLKIPRNKLKATEPWVRQGCQSSISSNSTLFGLDGSSSDENLDNQHHTQRSGFVRSLPVFGAFHWGLSAFYPAHTLTSYWTNTDPKHMHTSLEEHQVVCLSCLTCEGHFLTVPSMSADEWLPLSDSLVCVMTFQVPCQAMPVCTCHIMSTWFLSFCQQGATKQVTLVSVLPCSCMSVCLARCLGHGCGGLHSHCHTAMGASSANSQ
jgi:hypothetical protein